MIPLTRLNASGMIKFVNENSGLPCTS